jgi:hypothetical protein
MKTSWKIFKQWRLEDGLYYVHFFPWELREVTNFKEIIESVLVKPKA